MPPFTSPVAISPTVGAWANWPGRDPSGTCPLSFGCSPTTAMSTLPLPAALAGPGGALGGGGAPLENDGAPIPSGSAARAVAAPVIFASGSGTSAVCTGITARGGTLAGRRRNESFARLRDLHGLSIGLLRFVHVPVRRGRRNVGLRRFHALRVRFVDLRFGLRRRGRRRNGHGGPGDQIGRRKILMDFDFGHRLPDELLHRFRLRRGGDDRNVRLHRRSRRGERTDSLLCRNIRQLPSWEGLYQTIFFSVGFDQLVIDRFVLRLVSSEIATCGSNSKPVTTTT